MGGGDEAATILIVEDEPAVADVFEAALADAHDVTLAEDGGTALEELHDDLDVVLLDRRMPDLSGDQVMDEIAAQNIDVRVAMVTAVDPDFDVVDMGFDDYLVKPIQPDELRATVDRLLTLEQYEETYQELSSNLVKRNIIEVEKTEDELEESDEYRELMDEIRRLEDVLARMQHEQDIDDRLLPG